MKRLTLILSACLASQLAAGAQTGQNDLQLVSTGLAGSPFTILVDMDENAFAGVVFSLQTGRTQVAAVEFDLAPPLIPVNLGMTDPNGQASLTVTVPPGIPTGLALHGQALTAVIENGSNGPEVRYRTSNVETFIFP